MSFTSEERNLISKIEKERNDILNKWNNVTIYDWIVMKKWYDELHKKLHLYEILDCCGCSIHFARNISQFVNSNTLPLVNNDTLLNLCKGKNHSLHIYQKYLLQLIDIAHGNAKPIVPFELCIFNNNFKKDLMDYVKTTYLAIDKISIHNKTVDILSYEELDHTIIDDIKQYIASRTTIEYEIRICTYL